MNNVYDVVNFFLSKSSMSPKKLQKLLYYAYAWSLALLNDDPSDLSNRLFDSPIEAWVHGPVIPEVYFEYKPYGWDNIPQIHNFDSSVFSEETLNILEQVWNVYGTLTGNQLEAISHKEEPWLKARKDIPAYAASTNKLSDSVIFEYFNQQAYGE